MANTYTALFYHIVFSTKNRVDYIKPDVEERVWRYIGGVARKHDMTALQIGGVEDHVHALVMARPTHAPSDIAKSLKGDSSKWIHDNFPNLQRFAWQDGYGAFTVSKSNIGSVVSYIQKQREHHRKKTFQEEYLELLTLQALNMMNDTCGGDSVVATRRDYPLGECHPALKNWAKLTEPLRGPGKVVIARS